MIVQTDNNLYHFSATLHNPRSNLFKEHCKSTTRKFKDSPFSFQLKKERPSSEAFLYTKIHLADALKASFQGITPVVFFKGKCFGCGRGFARHLALKKMMQANC